MSVETLREFFLWCTIINVSLLVVSFGICAGFGLGDWIYRMHGRFFSMSRESFNVAIYAFLGLYKILIFVFNLVPYIALLIVG